MPEIDCSAPLIREFDEVVLDKLIQESVKYMRKNYETK
jgi:hypothetical protein